MRRKFAVVCAATCMLFIVATTRQAHAINLEFAVGPKIDLGAGFFIGEDWMRWLDNSGRSNRGYIDFSIGALFDLNFAWVKNFGFGLQPEFLFTITGGGSTRNGSNYSEVMFPALEIPIYFKARYKIGKGSIYFLLGPDFLFVFGDGTITTVAGNTETTDHAQIDNPAHVGLGIGLGYDLDLGPGNLELGMNFTPYFTNYYDNTSQQQFKFAFVVGYAFEVIK